MLRQRWLVFGLLAVAVPAAAQTFGFSIGSKAPVCLSIADTQYRLAAPDESADYTVRIDPAAAAPDVRVQLAATIDEADFAFVEGSHDAPHCRGSKAVKIDDTAQADLTVGFASSSALADYRIYVRSRSLSAEAAAALYAVAHPTPRRLARANGSN